MNAQDLDPRLKYIRELHEFHKGGKLRILIGAGTSIPSGFPTWDQLNLRLLEGYLAQERFSSDGKDRLGSDQIPELAQKLYTTLGREGAVDFVRVAQKTRASGAFEKLLAEALYCGR